MIVTANPYTVILKALGYPRQQFEEAMNLLKHSRLRFAALRQKCGGASKHFRKLSFTRPAFFLTYWDWFVQKIWPYAPHNSTGLPANSIGLAILLL